MLRFIIRHIIRSPSKTALLALVAAFFVLVMGFLQETINDTEAEIDRLYDTTIVHGELRVADPMLVIQNEIVPLTVRRVMETGFVQNIYYEAFQPLQFMVNSTIEQASRDFWHDFWWDFLDNYVFLEARADPILGFNNIETFLLLHGEIGLTHRIPGFGIEGLEGALTPVEIAFGEGFTTSDFTYFDYSLQMPIPVIVSQNTLELRGLNVGDVAFFTQRLREPGDVVRDDIHTFEDFHDFLMEIEMRMYPIQIIGVHNGAIRGYNPNSTFMPMAALELIRVGRPLGITALHFEVNPAFNRDFSEVQAALNSAADSPAQRSAMRLEVFLLDAELRYVVNQMESNLTLLQTLRPVAIAVSLIIGAGLTFLITLQSAKRAAIVRVLGMTKTRTTLTLTVENLLICAFGAAVGLVFMPIFGLAAIYIGATALGSIAGAMKVISKPPLELVQVKE
jgi:hypothetical protein